MRWPIYVLCRVQLLWLFEMRNDCSYIPAVWHHFSLCICFFYAFCSYILCCLQHLLILTFPLLHLCLVDFLFAVVKYWCFSYKMILYNCKRSCGCIVRGFQCCNTFHLGFYEHLIFIGKLWCNKMTQFNYGVLHSI